MAREKDFFSPEILRASEQITLTPTRMLSGISLGNFKSRLKGSGMQFKEFRPYEPGDEIRNIHWPVSARTQRTMVKIYEEEKQTQAAFWVDCSGSSLGGFHGHSKKEAYRNLIAAIGLACIKKSEKISVGLFDEKVFYFIPPTHSVSALKLALDKLDGHNCLQAQAEIGKSLEFLRMILKNKTICFLFSDFYVSPFQKSLNTLSHAHDVVLMHASDPWDRGECEKGIYPFSDPETGKSYLIDLSSKKNIEKIKSQNENLSHGLKEICLQSKSSYFSLKVDNDYLADFVAFGSR